MRFGDPGQRREVYGVDDVSIHADCEDGNGEQINHDDGLPLSLSLVTEMANWE